MKGIRKIRQSGTLFRKGETREMRKARLAVRAEKAGKASSPSRSVQSTEDSRDENREQRQAAEDSLPCLGSRLVDLDYLVSMMNKVLQGHQRFPARCEAPELVLYSEWRVGRACELQFSCTTCGFVSLACRTSGLALPLPDRRPPVAENPIREDTSVETVANTERRPVDAETSDVQTVGDQSADRGVSETETSVVRELGLRSAFVL